VASGSPCSIGDIAGHLSNAFGPRAPRPIVTGRYRLGDVRHIVASPERAREFLGFRAEVTIADGLARLRRELDLEAAS
jgi:dTDP-L-rhamnose 4-epimerase